MQKYMQDLVDGMLRDTEPAVDQANHVIILRIGINHAPFSVADLVRKGRIQSLNRTVFGSFIPVFSKIWTYSNILILRLDLWYGAEIVRYCHIS